MSGGRWFKVAAVQEFEIDPMQAVEVDGDSVLVCLIAGRYYAVEDRCSHDDGPLEDGELRGCEIVCPRHGARFDVTSGKALSMPAVTPIATFATKVEDGVVWVEVP